MVLLFILVVEEYRIIRLIKNKIKVERRGKSAGLFLFHCANNTAWFAFCFSLLSLLTFESTRVMCVVGRVKLWKYQYDSLSLSRGISISSECLCLLVLVSESFKFFVDYFGNPDPWIFLLLSKWGRDRFPFSSNLNIYLYL